MAEEDEGRMGTKLSAPADFDGPKESRHCTDIFCMLLLVCTWIAMTALGIYAIRNGDYRVVVYPLDYDGNICGTNKGKIDMTDYPKIVYINELTGGVCVKECPEISNLVDIHTFVTYGGIYQGQNATLPKDYISIANYSTSDSVVYCDESLCPTDPSTNWKSKGINEGYGFAFYALDTIEIGELRCIANPKAEAKLEELVDMTDTFDFLLNNTVTNTASDVISDLYADLYTARKYIFFFGFAVAMGLGLVYSLLLRIRFLLGFLVWTSILVSIGVIFAVGWYAHTAANEWDDAAKQQYSDSTILATKIFAYILFGIGGFAVLLVIFLRKAIQLAMSCVKEASRALSAMPLLVLFPLIQCLGFIAFFIVLLIYCIHLASLGEQSVLDFPIDTSTTISVRTYDFDENERQAGWFLLFCYFWTSAFIVAIGDLVVAMCVAKWYFTRNKSNITSCVLFRSIGIAMYYHAGTAAFGAAILAIIQMIQAIVAKIQKKAKEVDSKVAQALLCCCQCCLWCFKNCIEFLNKNAYIQTAIFGTSFCKSSLEAFQLILRNARRVASITAVSHFVIFVGKIFICVVAAGASYVVIDEQIGTKLDNIIGPCLCVFFMAYFVSDMFMDVFEMCISTILQCFIADEEMFDGDECYAEGDLRKWLDDFEEDQKRIMA